MKRSNRSRRQKCIGCGECCGHYLPMTAKEIADIQLYVYDHNISPNPSPMSCPWLAKNLTCAIYQVRPAICRAFHCDRARAGKMPGEARDYHVYNTMRLFTEGDMTHYDGLVEIAAGAFGGESFGALFAGDAS